MQPAGLRSIRWQLPFTYALIALVSAVALGVLLISLLREYYWQQEYNILDRMAGGLAQDLGYRLTHPLDATTLETLPSFSIPPNYRIEFFSPQRDTVFDTGVFNTLTIEFSQLPDDVARPIMLPEYVGGSTFTMPSQLPIAVYPVDTVTVESAAQTTSPLHFWPVDPMAASVIEYAVPETTSVMLNSSGSGGSNVAVATLMPTIMPPLQEAGTTAALAMRWPLDAQDPVFSDVSIAIPDTDVIWRVSGDGQSGVAFVGAQDMRQWERASFAHNQRSSASVMRMVTSRWGEILGYVRLSNMPALGSDLIGSVTSAAIVAGAGATIIAALLGWWVSLRLTRPLLVLNDATARMSHGDLGVRVDIQRRDELGALAISFNGMANKVEATIAALRRFAADAAHELHTPLTAIKTNLELTRERPDAARLTEAVAQIRRLEALADDLLDLSRLEIAEPPRQTKVDIDALVRDVSEVYASRAEQAGIEFALNVPEPLPTTRANAQMLRRAIANLLDNAVKFTPAGGDVSLTAHMTAGRVAFIVEDSGIGVPPADLPVLFSRFHRGSNTSDYPGSGLGLAIVKAIADVHSGTVTAESTARGARFVLQVPLPSDIARRDR